MRYMIANPTATTRQIAAAFGVTSVWISALINSDIFRSRYNELQEKLDGATIMPLREKLVGIANAAADKLMEQMEHIDDPKFIKETMNDTLKALGYGAKGQTNVFMPGASQTNNTVSADVLHAAQAKRAKLLYPIEEPLVNGKLIKPTPDGLGYIIPEPPPTPILDELLMQEDLFGEVSGLNNSAEYNADARYAPRRSGKGLGDDELLGLFPPDSETSPTGDAV
jgi:hypothetical protein